MVKVSVILPIYNVAPYLDETFGSLLNQSLKEIEIIAVNDGSTDNSEDIIRKYQQQDSRIMCYSQKNQGLSVTRNVALQYATGEYIYMMHSDDILSQPDALQICYDYIKKNKADFIFLNKKYKGADLLNLMLDHRIHNSVVWLLLINRQYMNQLGLSFYPGIIHEDELFTTILTLNSDSVFCIKQSFIKHRIRSTSIMGQKYTKRNLDCYLTVFDELFKFQDSPIIRKFAKYTLSKVFYTGHQIPFTEKPSVFWRAMKSGYLKYIGWKSSLVFWLK